ncbi:hypothetical protein J7J26_02255 [Candidatus Micrarchaeota archaeon]|nr:hypothetical protein [Candidatus Micrarchaeota archaeon]
MGGIKMTTNRNSIKMIGLSVIIISVLFLSACIFHTGKQKDQNETLNNIINNSEQGRENISVKINASKSKITNTTIEKQNNTEQNVTTEKEPCKGLFGDDYDSCMAIQNNDINYCSKDNCYQKYALAKNDLDACEYMSTDAMKCYCKSLISPDKCVTCPSKSSKELCYTLLTENTENDYCQYIETPRYQRDCFTYMAVQEHNKNLCKQIDDSYMRDECYREYAKETGDVSACKEQFVESWIDACYRDAAYANNKPQLCNDISNFRNQRVCYSVIFESDDYLLDDCYEITYPEWKNRCIKFLAINERNKSICDFIEDYDDKQRCMVRVEEFNND